MNGFYQEFNNDHPVIASGTFFGTGEIHVDSLSNKSGVYTDPNPAGGRFEGGITKKDESWIIDSPDLSFKIAEKVYNKGALSYDNPSSKVLNAGGTITVTLNYTAFFIEKKGMEFVSVGFVKWSSSSIFDSNGEFVKNGKNGEILEKNKIGWVDGGKALKAGVFKTYQDVYIKLTKMFKFTQAAMGQ